ncbi:MAG: hypothetical protein U0Q19_15760 [Kineosporiaceae bacterium]
MATREPRATTSQRAGVQLAGSRPEVSRTAPARPSVPAKTNAPYLPDGASTIWR